MKLLPFLPKALVVICSLSFISLNAQSNQSLQFKSGNFIPTINVVNELNYNASELVNGNYYRIVQFSSLPSTKQKQELATAGIDLLTYLPKNAFYASIKVGTNLNELLSNGAISVLSIAPSFKLNKTLKSEKYPEWALVNKNSIEINAVYHSNILKETILSKLQEQGVEVTMSNDAQMVRFIIRISELENLYAQPEFYYFEELDKPGEPENLVGRSDHRSNTVATDYFGGLKYDGTGVTVMLQDNSKLDEHIDYTGRFFNSASASQSGDHGEHCGGTIAGAGNLDPKGRGMAYGAEVLVYGSDNNNYNDVPTLVTSSNLTITSKSYSNGTNAGYTSLARQLDQQIRQMPELIHVFSAGNAGSGWSTITGGHKQGKNVMTVANLTYTDVIANSSSRGPAQDGRIKPDISAVGTNVYSTFDPNMYQDMTGTSMSCPGVAGVTAQLYHAYKSLNSGVNPNSALIKSAILNTADDLGNSGPDFIYGWGRINARRAYKLLSNNNYLSSTISQGGNNSHSINVPAGTTQLRVMVYWSDYEGAASANPALVNDINMQVVNPSATSFDPWVLNPSSPTSTAVRAVDDLNNVEQVTIDNPAAGNYSININGSTIAQGPQEYFVVYEFIQDEVVLTYPIGREGFDPTNATETIRWDSYGGTGTFDIEYSTDNGGSWNTINSSVASSVRHYDWNVPNVVTGQALVRVTRGAQSDVSDKVFSIIDTPVNLQIDWACPDSMQMSWLPVSGATSYEVSMLGNKYMDSVGVTNTNSYVFYGINPTQTYWLSVRAHGPTNARGERAIAVEKTPGTFNCPIAIDVELSGLDPLDNAQFLDCMVSNLDVDISIKNDGQTVLSNIPVHYQFNGGTAVNEVYAGPLNPGASVTHTFATQISPIGGSNTLLVWSDMTGDGNSYNDSVTSQFTSITSTLQTLPWNEDFETFGLCGTASDCENEVCAVTNGFINEANGSVDDIDWRTDQGGTPSNNTGPSQDYNPGSSSGNYLYLEASGGCNSQYAELVTPCIDLTNASAAQLDFAYNMNGADMGNLYVDVYSNATWTNNVTLLSGDKGTNWFVETVPLTSFLGNVINIRFRGRTGSDYASDLAIDDINVSGTVGVDELSNSLNFSIYPNPSNGLFNYTYSDDSELTIELYDITGKMIFTETISGDSSNNEGMIDIRNYTNGIYMMVLTSDTDRVTKKIVKK